MFLLSQTSLQFSLCFFTLLFLVCASFSSIFRSPLSHSFSSHFLKTVIRFFSQPFDILIFYLALSALFLCQLSSFSYLFVITPSTSSYQFPVLPLSLELRLFLFPFPFGHVTHFPFGLSCLVFLVLSLCLLSPSSSPFALSLSLSFH